MWEWKCVQIYFANCVPEVTDLFHWGSQTLKMWEKCTKHLQCTAYPLYFIYIEKTNKSWKFAENQKLWQKICSVGKSITFFWYSANFQHFGLSLMKWYRTTEYHQLLLTSLGALMQSTNQPRQQNLQSLRISRFHFH